MLARGQRLKRTADFARVRGVGKSWSNPFIVLCVAPNQLATSRFGFSVSKRIGNAVCRNRVKRRLREAVRAYVDLLKPGYDVVIIARVGVRPVCFAEVAEAVAHLLGRARLFLPAGDAPIAGESPSHQDLEASVDRALDK